MKISCCFCFTTLCEEFAIGHIAWDVTSQFSIFVSHRSSAFFRDILLIFLVAQWPSDQGSTMQVTLQKQKQKLTAGNQPACSILAPGPAGTLGLIFVQCQDLCFVLFSLSLILLIEKGGVGLLYIYRMVFTYYTLRHLRLLFPLSGF
jgi:hypothetical protein